jgi:predicted ATP-grasp superfamily ATP-dependent carboligase
MTKLHLDVYSPNFTSFKIKLEAVDGSNREIEVHLQNTRAWNSYDLDLSTYTGVNLAQIKWIVPVTNAGTNMYVDNVYFIRQPADPAKNSNFK